MLNLRPVLYGASEGSWSTFRESQEIERHQDARSKSASIRAGNVHARGISSRCPWPLGTFVIMYISNKPQPPASLASPVSSKSGLWVWDGCYVTGKTQSARLDEVDEPVTGPEQQEYCGGIVSEFECTQQPPCKRHCSWERFLASDKHCPPDEAPTVEATATGATTSKKQVTIIKGRLSRKTSDARPSLSDSEQEKDDDVVNRNAPVTSAEEMWNYPSFMWEQVDTNRHMFRTPFVSSRRDFLNYIADLIENMDYSTSWSGVDQPGSTLVVMIDELSAKLGRPVKHMRHRHAIEKSPSSRKELLDHPSPPEHMAGDLSDAWQPHIKVKIDQLIQKGCVPTLDDLQSIIMNPANVRAKMPCVICREDCAFERTGFHVAGCGSTTVTEYSKCLGACVD